MNRTRTLDRRYRHILYGGLAVSAGVHAALLGVRFHAELPGEDSPIEVERIVERPLDDVIEIVALQDALEMAQAGVTAELAPGRISDAAPAAPSQSAAASASASAPPVPAPTVPAVAFEELTVVDPLSQAPIRPVVFTDLPLAMAEAPVDSDLEGEAEDDVEVYIPGSIGAAKRAWSGSTGTNPLGGGNGGLRIFGGVGGGHCPMPGGGGRAVPPIWK